MINLHPTAADGTHTFGSRVSGVRNPPMPAASLVLSGVERLMLFAPRKRAAVSLGCHFGRVGARVVVPKRTVSSCLLKGSPLRVASRENGCVLISSHPVLPHRHVVWMTAPASIKTCDDSNQKPIGIGCGVLMLAQN